MTYSTMGQLVLVGAGNMGGAMLTGWLKSGVPGSSVTVIDPGPSDAMLAQIADAGATYSRDVPADLKAGILFLALKPQVMATVLPGLKALVGPQTVVVSVAAGKTLAFMEEHLGAAAMVRAMPNTPAMIGRGVTGAFANAAVSAEQRDIVHRLLKVSGPVEWLEGEEQINAVTAVSGSGPAYVFLLAESMIAAGIQQGLPADAARTLVLQTVLGAARMLTEAEVDAAELRRRVTSPGGTTQAAIDTFETGGLRTLVDAAIHAARVRGAALSAAND